jgi:hypothetical protein
MPTGAWLGVHLTFDVAHRARVGPDIAWVDNVSYDFEDADGARRARFKRAVCRYWPGLPDGALAPTASACAPRSTAKASRSPILRSTGRASTGCRVSLRSTASRAPSASTWRRCSISDQRDALTKSRDLWDGGARTLSFEPLMLRRDQSARLPRSSIQSATLSALHAAKLAGQGDNAVRLGR